MNQRSEISETQYRLLSKIFRSPTRRSIVLAMLNGCVFPNQIQKVTEIGFPLISKNLKQLEKYGIIRCKNPSKKVGRIHILVEEIEKMKDTIFKWLNRFELEVESSKT
ncbi:MAG: hypothetical protein ACFE8B_15885 [Candidatus Hermodarchaeota archaeon]